MVRCSTDAPPEAPTKTPDQFRADLILAFARGGASGDAQGFVDQANEITAKLYSSKQNLEPITRETVTIAAESEVMRDAIKAFLKGYGRLCSETQIEIAPDLAAEIDGLSTALGYRNTKAALKGVK